MLMTRKSSVVNKEDYDDLNGDYQRVEAQVVGFREFQEGGVHCLKTMQVFYNDRAHANQTKLGVLVGVDLRHPDTVINNAVDLYYIPLKEVAAFLVAQTALRKTNQRDARKAAAVEMSKFKSSCVKKLPVFDTGELGVFPVGLALKFSGDNSPQAILMKEALKAR